MSIGFSAGSLVRLSKGRYRVDFSAGFGSARLATGLEKLAMEVIYFLWTSEGQIWNDLTRGTGLPGMVGSFMIGGDTTPLRLALAEEVAKAESRIRARQAGSDLPADERLKQLLLDAITIDADNLVADLQLIIRNDLDQAVGLQVEAMRSD